MRAYVFVAFASALPHPPSQPQSHWYAGPPSFGPKTPESAEVQVRQGRASVATICTCELALRWCAPSGAARRDRCHRRRGGLSIRDIDCKHPTADALGYSIRCIGIEIE